MSGRIDSVLLEFNVARQNRVFEIQMFWQRANYFLVLHTALAVGAYTVNSLELSALIALFGVLAAFLWFRTNLGSKFWQSFWENEVHRLAKLLDVRALALTDAAIFEDAHEIEAQEDTSFLKRWLNRRIRSKPTVSSNMIWLSLWTIVAWSGVACFFLIKWFLKAEIVNRLSSCVFQG